MSELAAAVAEWIAHDPDPEAAAELAACSEDDLEDRFARPLAFGTAGLRGPMRAGPNGMNLAVVLRATWALAKVLADRSLGEDLGGSEVVVGYDARHRSAEFGRAAAEVLAAQGFSVTLMFAPVPTPAVAFAVRSMGATAGVQITASHNPASDNGYKVYFPGGLQIVSPTDRDIESAIAKAPPADEIPRAPVTFSGEERVRDYLERAAAVRRTTGSARVALTPMHGVGGEFALDALALAGFSDVHVVESQFAPDPDFPTVAFPNPEEPGAVDALLTLAADIDAEIAVALDPDADRCAVGVLTPVGWRMLSGDETGWLLGEYILSGDQDRTGRGGQYRGVLADAVAHRRGPRCAPCRDADGVQVAGACRRRPPGARSSTPTKRRSGIRGSRRGPRQGRHQRRRAGVRPGRRAAPARTHGA